MSLSIFISGCVPVAKSVRQQEVNPVYKETKEAKKYSTKNVRFISAADLDIEEGELEDYQIDIGDILEISVWQIEELQREVVVRPDGKISFPLIGDVSAEGRTIQELTDDIVEKIKLYIKTPQVSVNILEFGGKTAVVLGEVDTEGLIRFNRPTTVIDAIGLAGGFADTSNMDKVFVIRNLQRDEPTVILVNTNSILKRANLKENILVHSGDIIYIPRAMIADFKFFMDNVFGPLITYAQTYYGDTWRRRAHGEWQRKSDIDNP